MIIEDKEIGFDIEVLKPQVHENMAAIPLKSKISYRLDLLTLKKGLELGLVEVKECEQSTVNTIKVTNNAVTPLILIDGEEILGANQNRIVNSTLLIAPKTTQAISVSCTGHGRWEYKNEFKQSEYIADFNTRRVKEFAKRSHQNSQQAIWDSIKSLEVENSFKSPTSAMSESYDNLKISHNEFLKAFEIVDGQCGVLVIQNGEIKGFEIFYNPQIYKEYHEKVLRSYLMNNKVENTLFTIDMDGIKSLMNNANILAFNKKDSEGMEYKFEFEDDFSLGNLYSYEDEIIHFSYFTKPDESITDDTNEQMPVGYVL
ncbi:ARPP-1 family domain-containing protein [Methanobrevibacter sp.]|uniref:ARPP-1 family domain-containing protein n=1 Tax=Methanobrevibacter sp. TaxID=66852 RepID=UPI00388D3D84